MYQKVTLTLPKDTVARLHKLADKGDRSGFVADLIDHADETVENTHRNTKLGLPPQPTKHQIYKKLKELKDNAGLYKCGPKDEEIINNIKQARNRHEWIRS